MSFVVLDTDVASASLRGRLPDRLRARLTGQTWCISFVTVGELTKWTVLRNWGPRKLAELAEWQRDVVLLSYSEPCDGKRRLASTDAGASYQPPHDGGGDEAEAEVAADQDEMEVGDPGAGLVAQ